MRPAYAQPLFTLTTGPVDIYPSVSRALAMPVWYDYDPAFQACFERVSLKAAQVLKSTTPPLILQGEPVLALEAAAASLINKQDKVLNVVNGVYSAGFGDWARRYSPQVEELRVEYNQVIDPEVLDRWLTEHPDIAIVSVCHHDTPSIAEINALEAALDLYLKEGEEQVWARHALTSQAFRAGIQAMGLMLWAASESVTSPSATAVKVPEGVNEEQWRTEARERYGVMFSSGRGETLGKVLRVGHMGPTAQPMYAIIAITALSGALNQIRGEKVDIAAGIAAAMKVIG